jgi:hypothetical protein
VIAGTLVVAGAMLMCTRRRVSTLVALALPLVFAVLMVFMLTDVTI